jgi:hypothetical protein
MDTHTVRCPEGGPRLPGFSGWKPGDGDGALDSGPRGVRQSGSGWEIAAEERRAGGAGQGLTDELRGSGGSWAAGAHTWPVQRPETRDRNCPTGAVTTQPRWARHRQRLLGNGPTPEVRYSVASPGLHLGLLWPNMRTAG